MEQENDRVIRETYDTVMCPTCEKVTPIGEHCIYCGAQLAQIPVTFPVAKCQRCGMYGPSGDYCGACGVRMVSKTVRTYLMEDE